jgi:hypothetical protein
VSEISRTIPDLQGAGEGLKWIQDNLFNGLRGGPVDVTLGRPKRTNDQNALLWAVLTDVSEQVDWYGRNLSKEEWKDVFSAAWKQQDVVPGINGGFVVMGVRTSKMSKAQLSELVEIIYAFGAEKTVKWSEKSIESFNQYRESQQ